VALLILPWVGFMCNTWLGVVLGIVVYIGSRIYSPEEEKLLSKIFGVEWENAHIKSLFVNEIKEIDMYKKNPFLFKSIYYIVLKS
jgi:hypothetical protein